MSLFSSSHPELGIAEISRLMGLPKPTVHGLVQTLLGEGYLNQDEETRKYSVGLKLVELGSLQAGNLKINQVGGDLVQRLAVNTGLHARIAIWDHDSMLITLDAFPSVENIVLQRVGPRVPAYCTAVGKAVLFTMGDVEISAYIERNTLHRFTHNTITDTVQLKERLKAALESGYVTENNELLLGMSCVAVPIFDASCKAMGAISLSGTPDSIKGKRLSDVVPRIIQTGFEISRRMGYFPETMPSSNQAAG